MRSTGTLIVCLVILLPAWLARAGEDPAEQRIFYQFRAAASSECGPGSCCVNSIGLEDRPEIAPTHPLYQKVSGLFSRGCALSGEKPPKVPLGRLVSWDIDNDGAAELVFAGGCSPEPYFVILKGADETWRVFMDSHGRFLSTSRDDNWLYIVSALDAYGVERDNSLTVRQCDPQGKDACSELTFRWAGEWKGIRADGIAIPCSTVLDADLRIDPVVDDAPRESGIGFEWPGSLYQRLAKGSSGWLLEKTQGPDGASWALCVFPAPPVAALDQDPKQISKPKLAQRVPLTDRRAKLDLLVGWVKFDVLSVP